MRKKNIKVLVLLSGGLDSILAVKLLLEQGIEVEAVNFLTNFCGPSKARPAAKFLGVPLREVDISEDFLAVLKKPKHGYGAALNPCIDCHALMLKKAGEIMKEEKFDFVATGEVLGQRPMSQHKKALEIVEKEAGLLGRLLRPLSAKLLPETLAEKEGLVDREELLGIFGRSREIQMALAQKFGIENYPSPAGGCALTQEGFAGRLKKIMEFKPDFSVRDLELAKIGRHFFEDGFWLILGRNETENDILKNLTEKNDTILELKDIPSPLALLKNNANEKILARAKKLILEFSPKAKGKKTEFLASYF